MAIFWLIGRRQDGLRRIWPRTPIGRVSHWALLSLFSTQAVVFLGALVRGLVRSCDPGHSEEGRGQLRRVFCEAQSCVYSPAPLRPPLPSGPVGPCNVGEHPRGSTEGST